MTYGGKREGAGRKKGIANKLAMDYKELIAQSNPIQFLIDAFTNGYIEGNVEDPDDMEQYLTLTLKERCDIAKDLAKKIVPDVKAIEHTGKDGEAINHSITVQFVKCK